MEFELKKLSTEAIPPALERAERYRLLNEPLQAESICLDILAVEPASQQALVLLLLALSGPVLAFRKFFNHLAVESANVIGCAAGDDPVVCDHFLVYPIAAGIADIRLKRRPRGERPPPHATRFNQRP